MTETQTSSAASTSGPAGSIAWPALAAVVHMMIVSAAFETLRSGSQVRWWVLVGVLAYGLALFAVWRMAPRLGTPITPIGLATSGGGVLLGLLVVTAWLPEGATTGVRLLGQPTSTLLAALTAVAVALAGHSLVRWQRLPAWTRYTLFTIAAYGVLSFAHGIVSATLYWDLFHGRGFWTRLPFWLQGAFVGGWIVLPLGIVASLVESARAGATSRKWTAWLRPGLLGLALAMSLSAMNPGSHPGTGGGVAGNRAADGQAAIAGQLGGASAELEAADVPFASVLPQIEALSSRLPRDRTDPAAVVSTMREPARLLEWVRENTRLVSYEGSLRGPLGVLMDRRGNSLDRALLLARLLELAGHQSRVVGGKLSTQDASQVLSANRGGSTPHASAPDDRARQATMISGMILRKTRQLPLANAHVLESTHYWVQYNNGQQWADADPTLPAIGVARPHTDAVRVPVDPTTHGVAPSFTAGVGHVAHAVTMRVVVERWDAGRLVESQLARVPLNSSDGPLVATAVTFVPVDQGRKQVVERLFTSGAELRGQLLKETTWAVVLRDSNSRWRMGRMFDETGTVGPIPGTKGAAQMGAATVSAMEGLLGLGGDGESAGTVLTALIADYEMQLPGRPARLVRRFIFDSIGPEARRASTSSIARPEWTDQQRADRGADLAALNDTVVAFASLPAEVYASRYARRVIESKDALLQVDAGSADAVALDRAENGISIRTLELFAATRDSTMSPDLAVTEPQIYRRTIRCVPDTNATGLNVQVLADLAWNRLGPTGAASGAETLVTQGVLDTLQESTIVHNEPTRPDQTTAGLLDEATKQGIEIVALRDPGDPRLSGYPVSARARMVSDLEAGQVLVAPSKAVAVGGHPRVGWWRLDPNTGHVVGAMDTGLLQGDTEYATTEDLNGIKIVRFKKPPPTPGPAARAYVRDLAARKPGISEDALKDIAIAVQRFILKTGSLPL